MLLPAYMTYGVAPQRRAVSKKWGRALAYTHFVEFGKVFSKKKIKMILEKHFDPLMIPRVGFYEERANKRKPPSTTKGKLRSRQGLAGIHPARMSADQAMQAAARTRS
jgi:hypothetical protein